MSIYDITVKNRKGEDVNLADFKGKVLLIVNTATGCGFTPQYKGLEELYQKYHKKGLEILDFPCNQFGYQAPGSDDEIHEFCTAKYKTTFDQFKKIDVNGENESPVFTCLKEQIKEDEIEGLKNKMAMKNDNIIVDHNMETNVKGLYSCGNSTGGLLQVCKAVYEGAKAGLAVVNFLNN